MNPGTYYLYEYANAARKRTVGFIKIEKHYRSCILQIHAKSIPVPDGGLLSLNAFFSRENKIIHNKIAEISSCQNGLSIRLTVSERNFPENTVLENLDGFFIQQISGDPFLLWIASSLQDLNTDLFFAAETPDTPELHAAGQEEEETGESPVQLHARKIRRADLSLLPRKFWPLANNSFLLHGYHNYGHLMLLEESGYMWLGVPGIYDLREARAADLFGFSRFTRTGAQALPLSEDECSTDENFGHWCRYLGPGGPCLDLFSKDTR